MRWLRQEVIGDDRKKYAISNRHLTIRAIFHNPMYGWNELSGQAVYRLCTQHIAENILKECQNQMVVSKF
jgi:hypothetical protein